MASMGPRHCCRGIYSGQVAGTVVDVLQWGHGIAAVESKKLDGRPRWVSSFNGATALLPWNHAEARGWEGAHYASMGPRHCCRGIR